MNLFLEDDEQEPLVFRFDGNTVYFRDDDGERLYVDMTYRSSAHGFVLDGIRHLRKVYSDAWRIHVQDPTGQYKEWMKRRSKTADIPIHVW